MLWGPEAQRRLAECHVILFGLGGVGSYAAECLARAGIGELTIVDSDTVALTKNGGSIDALSGATITSRSITGAVSTAIKAVESLG